MSVYLNTLFKSYICISGGLCDMQQNFHMHSWDSCEIYKTQNRFLYTQRGWTFTFQVIKLFLDILNILCMTVGNISEHLLVFINKHDTSKSFFFSRSIECIENVKLYFRLLCCSICSLKCYFC